MGQTRQAVTGLSQRGIVNGMRRRTLLPFVMAVVWGAGCAGQKAVTVAGPPPPAPPPNPQRALLYANLWVQTSAEYRALCLQIYRNAEAVVLARADGPASGKPAAVVLDLDETVIDNSGFQTWLYRNQTTYSSAAWTAWTNWQAKDGRARGVPGAAGFLRAMERAGVAAVYISNRRESERAATVAVLELLGIEDGDPGERLLLRANGSGKEPRREQARARWNVIAYFGDNLADFAPELEAQGANWRERSAAAEAAGERWGVEWFVLPNPMYGDWVQALGEPLEDRLQGPSELSAPQELQNQ